MSTKIKKGHIYKLLLEFFNFNQTLDISLVRNLEEDVQNSKIEKVSPSSTLLRPKRRAASLITDFKEPSLGKKMRR